jgi:hypothetical protein
MRGEWRGGSPSAGVFDGAVEFAFGVALFNVFAFVVRFFAAGEAKLKLYAAAFKVELEAGDSVAFSRDLAGEVIDFVFVEQEFAGAFFWKIEAVALLIGADLEVVYISFAAGDCYVAIDQAGAAGAEGFDFGSAEDYAGFKGVFDVVIMPRAAVGCDDFYRWGVGHGRVYQRGGRSCVRGDETNADWWLVLVLAGEDMV